MSRVWSNQKYMNVAHSKDFNEGPSKIVRIHGENENYHKAESLSTWLFMKYDMSYKTYSNKSKARKDRLRDEYVADTGNENPQDKAKRKYCETHWDDDDAYDLLASIGVPFLPDGTPLGIGDD